MENQDLDHKSHLRSVVGRAMILIRDESPGLHTRRKLMATDLPDTPAVGTLLAGSLTLGHPQK